MNLVLPVESTSSINADVCGMSGGFVDSTGATRQFFVCTSLTTTLVAPFRRVRCVLNV